MHKTFLIGLLFYAHLSQAAFDRQMLESNKCTRLFAYHEVLYDLPKNTLHSISLHETGRTHHLHKQPIPWPWSVNSEGRSFYFNTKAEAVEFVRQELQHNKTSIDVGCMQINLKYHGHHFKSVEHALDPKSNIDYGAKFLSQKFQQFHNWPEAIAHYHSAKSEFGQKYSKKVFHIAQNIEKHKRSINNFYRQFRVKKFDTIKNT